MLTLEEYKELLIPGRCIKKVKQDLMMGRIPQEKAKVYKRLAMGSEICMGIIYAPLLYGIAEELIKYFNH